LNIDDAYLDYYQGPVSDHFDGRQFFNPWSRQPKKEFRDFLKWRMEGNRATWPEKVENPLRPLPPQRLKEPKVTYIGHATFLVQIADINFLVDPVFSERCSPIQFIGPKRVRPPFLSLEQLPEIDYVFVSHNHYDHMDQQSLSWLAANRRPAIITPLGNPRLMKPYMKDSTFIALDWHQKADLKNGLTLTLVPAQHWSRRGWSDINRDLWGGCIIQDGKEKIYFSADTGFHHRLFEDIKNRYGSPDIAMLPIGAYEPRWFMEYSHMNPQDAINAFQILKPRKAIGFHFETFQLTDESFDSPRREMETLLNKNKIKKEEFLVPYPGDFLTV
jgi:L-ascorbate metabolism protein UlaG (beta-lactamase superfamily)